MSVSIVKAVYTVEVQVELLKLTSVYLNSQNVLIYSGRLSISFQNLTYCEAENLVPHTTYHRHRHFGKFGE